MNMTGVSSKVWLITCDCRALVKALAEAVLASGHNLVATDIDREPLRYLSECYGDQLRVVPIEVTDARAAESAVQAALDAFGRLDVLVVDLTKWRSEVSPPLWLQDHLHRSQVLPPQGRQGLRNPDELPFPF
jgi:NAD(P)-dependent dehydrogenase (short-subunit alcohol dehydrogenase family)